jgi:hypothetical protein
MLIFILVRELIILIGELIICDGVVLRVGGVPVVGAGSPPEELYLIGVGEVHLLLRRDLFLFRL